MELNEYYDYFFDNRGKCPTCGSHLVMHEGCINYNKGHRCGDAMRRTYKDKDFAVRRQLFSIFRSVINKRDEIYVYVRRQAKNLDKGPKKYHNIN
jgi:hypothetical protein